MRVLHVTPGFYPSIGGIERYVEDLCLNLKKLGYTSDVLTLNKMAYSKERLKWYEEYKGIKIFRIPFLNLKYYYIAPDVLKYVKGYDIIHIHGIGFFSDFLSITKPFHNKPLLLSTHGGIFHTKNIYWLKNIYFKLWCRLILKRMDSIISISPQDKKMFSKFRPILIPIGIYYEHFSNIKRAPKRNELLFIGRISRNKGIDNLIKMLYFLKRKIPDVKLYIIGRDWQGIKMELENLIEHLGLKGNVFFIEKVNEKEKISYLSRCQIFVSASYYEGFGITIVEAMASGIPVVANNIQAFRNLITNNENGFLINYSKPKEASEKIYKIMETNLKKISKRAKMTAMKYDWVNIIKRIEEIYSKTLNKDL